ncbi:hypothetical protein Tco_0098693 [Tanacetum coccineum]
MTAFCLRCFTAICLLRFVSCVLSPAFCLLRFVSCVLSLAFCLLRFVSCVLSLAFCLLLFISCVLPPAFCLLRFVSKAAFWVLNNQFQKFIDWQHFLDYDSDMTEKLFAEYTGIQVKQFRETLLLHMANVKKSVSERTHHKRQYDRRMKKRQMQSRESKVVLSKALDASLVATECGGTKSDEHITSSSSWTYITHVVDADIRPVNDQVPFAEVQLPAQHNVLANKQ